MSETKKVLITVMTYPTISKKYDELVCTAGVQQDGSWVRIYPLPYRRLDSKHQFKKYQWIELPLKKNPNDQRPESYSVTDMEKIKLLNKVDTINSLSEIQNIIFNKNQPIFTNLKKLISQANKNERSFAVFKPKIIDFTWVKTDRAWPKDKMDLLKKKAKQLSLFQTAEEIEKEFLITPKLPYKFKYKFKDDEGNVSNLMIEDWELGELFWDFQKKMRNEEGWQKEQRALVKVGREYHYKLIEKDYYFFLGTLKIFQGWAKNPFVIIGVFPPPINMYRD